MEKGLQSAAPLFVSFSFYPLPQELQKQIFQFPVAAQLVQIRSKLPAVKRNLLGHRSKMLFSGPPGFPPSFKDSLFLCCGRRTAAYNVLNGG